MENLWLLFLGFAVGLLAGIGIGWVLARRQTADITRLKDELKSATGDQVAEGVRRATEQLGISAGQLLDGKLRLGEQNLESRKSDIDKSLQSVKDGLQKVEALVNDYEKDRARKFGELSAQLTATAAETGKLQQSTDKLREVLASTKKRGQWGERMAEDVLRAAGFQEGINYRKQAGLESGSRPDFTIQMPRDLKLNLDAKFPLSSYLRFLDASSDDLREAARKQFVSDVRARVKEVAGKDYIDPAQGTVDNAVMFIPNESVYGFINECDPEFVNDALAKKVIPCSPMTLYAVLLVIRQAADNFNITRQRGEIVELVRAFNKEWEKFVQLMDKVGKKIGDAHEDYDQLTTTRERALQRQVDRIQVLTDGAAPAAEAPARLEGDR
jgi:DNA recombination protein RmuC